MEDQTIKALREIYRLLAKIEENTRPKTEKAKGKEIFKLWNELAPSVLPRAEKYNANRQKRANARYRENPDTECWKKAIGVIEKSNFLMGKNDRGWRANFDWLIAPGNVEKLLEGQYEANKGSSVDDILASLED